MSAPHETKSAAKRRERSTRYPGVSLDDAIALVQQMSTLGVDGLTAAAIAAALGYKNIRTHSFSSGLSSARQFGLIGLRDKAYFVTDLGKRALKSSPEPQRSLARRQAFQSPPLYAELCARFAGKRVPDAAALANWLHHNHGITSAAKLAAAEVFLASAREAGTLDDASILRLDTDEPAAEQATASAGSHAPAASAPRPSTDSAAKPAPGSSSLYDVEFTLALWGTDEGRSIQVRAPRSITSESLERLLQALRLHVRISDATS